MAQSYASVLYMYHHHHQPINVPTAGAQPFLIGWIRRMGHNPPRGPSAGWYVCMDKYNVHCHDEFTFKVYGHRVRPHLKLCVPPLVSTVI
jgi:hypothetical protein